MESIALAAGDKPSRYCIHCGLVKPNALVEIASVAHIGKK